MPNLLIDTNGVASRAFYADSTNPFLFVNMISKIQNEINYDNVYFMFDAKTNFRKKMYVNYKEGRQDSTERYQYIRMIWHVLKKAGFDLFYVESYEADDLIASACKTGDYILTGDKDLLALADKATVILLAGSFSQRKYYNSNEVYKRFGIWPRQWNDYRSFTGDSADSLPGIKGIGKVGAKKLLEEYGTLEAIYDHIEELPQSIAYKLIAGKDYGMMTRKLSQLITNIPLDLKPNKIKDITLAVPVMKKVLNL